MYLSPGPNSRRKPGVACSAPSTRYAEPESARETCLRRRALWERKKTLRPSLGRGTVLGQALLEAGFVAAGLDHAGIVRVLPGLL